MERSPDIFYLRGFSGALRKRDTFACRVHAPPVHRCARSAPARHAAALWTSRERSCSPRKEIPRLREDPATDVPDRCVIRFTANHGCKLNITPPSLAQLSNTAAETGDKCTYTGTSELPMSSLPDLVPAYGSLARNERSE